MVEEKYKVIYTEKGKSRGANYTGGILSMKEAQKSVAQGKEFDKRFGQGKERQFKIVKVPQRQNKLSNEFFPLKKRGKGLFGGI